MNNYFSIYSRFCKYLLYFIIQKDSGFCFLSVYTINMTKKVRKAVIPAAGFGTRFLPVTKSSPKEMLPVVDKPIIQYVVEDAVSAGIEDIIIVTGPSKRSIEDYFDYPFELEKRLEASGKLAELEMIRNIADLANFSYLRQKGPLGNATPIWNARHLIGNEPFLVLWGDDFFESSPSRCQQLVAAYEQFGGEAIMGTIRATGPEDFDRYGFASGSEIAPGVLKVTDVVEKPGKGYSGSEFAVVSGSLYGPEFFNCLEEALFDYEKNGSKGEFVYIEGVKKLISKGFLVTAAQIVGGVYRDCGNKLEYLKTVVDFALKHSEFGEEFREHLKKSVL